jgi:hypothetical protein
MPPIQPIEDGVRGLVYFQVVWISCVSSVPHQTAASTMYPTQHAGIATVPNASLFASATTRLIPTDSTCGQLFTIAQRSLIFRRKFVDTLGQAFQSGPLNFQGDLARRKIRAAGLQPVTFTGPSHFGQCQRSLEPLVVSGVSSGSDSLRERAVRGVA